jgi:hypothetical protein
MLNLFTVLTEKGAKEINVLREIGSKKIEPWRCKGNKYLKKFSGFSNNT